MLMFFKKEKLDENLDMMFKFNIFLFFYHLTFIVGTDDTLHSILIYKTDLTKYIIDPLLSYCGIQRLPLGRMIPLPVTFILPSYLIDTRLFLQVGAPDDNILLFMHNHVNSVFVAWSGVFVFVTILPAFVDTHTLWKTVLFYI